MTDLTSALRIGISGMQLSQVGLSTVSQNVVNANTAGYSRQTVQTSAASANGYGTGVQLDTIQRVSDRFLVSRVLTATSDATYASTKNSYLTSLENDLSSSSSGGGLESVVGGFITSMNSLTTDPSNSSLRRSVVQQATVTANALNNANTDLTSEATNADSAITSELGTVNQLLKDIYTLNTQITALQNSNNGANSNDLLDARAQKIATLSQSFGIQVNENTTTGSVRITTENGRKLVDESGYVVLSRGTASGSGYQPLISQNVMQDGSLSPTQLTIDTATLTTGKIKALSEIRDVTVPNLLAQVNQFTTTFMAAVNDIASQGTSSPPASSLTSGNTLALTSSATNLLTTPGFSAINNTTINISVTSNLGNALTTTAGGTPITLAPTAPATTLSLADIASIINNNPTVGNAALGGTAGVIATVTTNSSGQPSLTITAADSNSKVVMSNVTGDALGVLGMNNLFTGTDSASIAVRPDIVANADLLPVARMRADGGVSTTDNQNIIALASLSDKKLTFATAGGLGTQTATGVSYLNTIASNLAVATSAANDNETFTANLQTQASDLATSVSGVNINEELAQMLVYQNSFQASARIISVVNDMLKDLVDII